VDVGNEESWKLWCTYEILEGQVERPGTQVASTNANLHNALKILAGRCCNFAGVNLAGELGNSGLLFPVKVAKVSAGFENRAEGLAPGKVVEDAALFAGVHYFSRQNCAVLGYKFGLFRQFLQQRQRLVAYSLRCVIEAQFFGVAKVDGCLEGSYPLSIEQFPEARHCFCV